MGGAVGNDSNNWSQKSLADVGGTRGGGYQRNRHPSRNLLLVFLLCLVGVVIYWIRTGRFSADQPQSGVTHGRSKFTATLIFLHGLGGNGESMCERLLLTMHLPRHIRSVCPTAEKMNVTFRNRIMFSWFNILKLTQDSEEDERGINLAAKRIESVIAEEVALGVPRSRIILGGHSQGGATSLYTALTSAQDSLAGVFGTSTWLPLLRTFPRAFKGNKATPLFQSHGDADKLVAFSFGKKSSDMIKSYNTNAQFKVFKGLEHLYSDEVNESVKDFVIKYLPPV